MGYRNYLGVLPKREYNKIKRMSNAELCRHFGEKERYEEFDEDGYVGPYKICKELHGLGKYVDIDFPSRSSLPFFKTKSMKDRYKHYDFRVVKPEFLEAIIEHYKKRVQDYYKDLLEGIDRRDKSTWTEDRFVKLHQHVSSFDSEWNYLTPYNLKEGDEVTTSWKLEYSLFEFVRLYKTFDWKRNVMTWYGY